MKKSNNELLNEFSKLEKELIEKLKDNKLKGLKNLDSKTLKSEIKKYIKNLNSIKDTFNKYDKLAETIMAEKINQSTKPEESEYEDKLENGDGEVKVKKVKKERKEKNL